MFKKSLEQLKITHPNEYHMINELDNLERRLDSLINDQRNCLLYDPTCLNNTIRIHIYNTYSDNDNKPVNCLFSRVQPSMYTLYIKTYELDSNKNIIESPEVPVLIKYFRLILFDTPSGVLLWNRDHIESEKNSQFKPQKYHSNKHSQIPDNINNENKVNILYNQNGYDELHINRLGYSECDVNIYFFPTQIAPVFSLSKQLYDFLYNNTNDNLIHNEFQQATISTITRSIWSYALNNRLFTDSDNNDTFIIIDTELRFLFNINSNIDRIKISELPILLQPHLYPPRPIKVTHRIRHSGQIADNEQIIDLNMESCFFHNSKPGDIVTEFDSQIASLEHEVVELMHLHNFYKSFSDDPHKFITTIMDNKNPQNSKPITGDKLYTDLEYYRDPWIHYAIDNYLESNNKGIQDFIMKIFDNTPLGEYIKNNNGIS